MADIGYSEESFPASSRATVTSLSSDNRLATTQPAEPAPTNMGLRRTYIWSQLNPKSKGNFAIKSKSSEIIKSLNPSGDERYINTS